MARGEGLLKLGIPMDHKRRAWVRIWATRILHDLAHLVKIKSAHQLPISEYFLTSLWRDLRGFA
jgi:hypothetical protein